MPGLARIGTLIEEWLKRLNIEREVRLWQVLGQWEELVGPELKSRARPTGFRDHILFVQVASPIWMQELSARGMKERLKEEINRRLGQPLVKDVRFNLGSIEGEG